ncbi:MAG TPA: hypothetical protein VGA87_07090, partial [Pyrinomonadaceae bacterium]
RMGRLSPSPLSARHFPNAGASSPLDELFTIFVNITAMLRVRVCSGGSATVVRQKPPSRLSNN